MPLVYLFVYFARVDFCPISLPLGVRDWLQLVIVALPGLFYYLDLILSKNQTINRCTFRHKSVTGDRPAPLAFVPEIPNGEYHAV